MANRNHGLNSESKKGTNVPTNGTNVPSNPVDQTTGGDQPTDKTDQTDQTDQQTDQPESVVFKYSAAQKVAELEKSKEEKVAYIKTHFSAMNNYFNDFVNAALKAAKADFATNDDDDAIFEKLSAAKGIVKMFAENMKNPAGFNFVADFMDSLSSKPELTNPMVLIGMATKNADGKIELVGDDSVKEFIATRVEYKSIQSEIEVASAADVDLAAAHFTKFARKAIEDKKAELIATVCGLTGVTAEHAEKGWDAIFRTTRSTSKKSEGGESSKISIATVNDALPKLNATDKALVVEALLKYTKRLKTFAQDDDGKFLPQDSWKVIKDGKAQYGSAAKIAKIIGVEAGTGVNSRLETAGAIQLTTGNNNIGSNIEDAFVNAGLSLDLLK